MNRAHLADVEGTGVQTLLGYILGEPVRLGRNQWFDVVLHPENDEPVSIIHLISAENPDDYGTSRY